MLFLISLSGYVLVFVFYLYFLYYFIFFFFFFQAEDGIRDYKVTGVQTCALPISTISIVIRPVSAAAEASLSISFASVCTSVPTRLTISLNTGSSATVFTLFKYDLAQALASLSFKGEKSTTVQASSSAFVDFLRLSRSSAVKIITVVGDGLPR